MGKLSSIGKLSPSQSVPGLSSMCFFFEAMNRPKQVSSLQLCQEGPHYYCTLFLHGYFPFLLFQCSEEILGLKKKAAPGWSSGSGYWQPSYQAYLLKLTFRHAETTSLWANLSFNYYINWFICQYETKHHDIEGNEIWWINHCHICRYMN